MDTRKNRIPVRTHFMRRNLMNEFEITERKSSREKKKMKIAIKLSMLSLQVKLLKNLEHQLMKDYYL